MTGVKRAIASLFMVAAAIPSSGVAQSLDDVVVWCADPRIGEENETQRKKPFESGMDTRISCQELRERSAQFWRDFPVVTGPGQVNPTANALRPQRPSTGPK